MSKKFSFEVKTESIEELKKAINYDGLNEISKRFDNGTETEDDIINHCRNYRIKFENGNQLFVVEKQYFDKVIDLYQKEKEKNKDIANDLEKYKMECYLQGRKDEEKSMLGVIQRHYISKDKIREKIKEIEKRLRNEYDLYERAKENSDEQHAIHRRINMLNFVEDEIKELLEENNGKQM